MASKLRLAWDDVRLFLEIARAGTLSAAAPRMGLAQPTAGRRLRALEALVGASLFQRTPQGFRLTDEGEAILLHAERMADDAQALERKLLGQARGLEGVVRVSSSDWFSNLVLASPLTDFAIAQPRVTVELIADWRTLDLERHEADLVLRFQPFAGSDGRDARRHRLILSRSVDHQEGGQPERRRLDGERKD
jgi:DNA-binding transcriptional LysR family regulator